MDNAFIPRDAPLHPAEDWEALRRIGMDRVRALSGAVWTDHNAHDPGVTLLEALAWAVADLGYRAGFPTADLLTRPDGLIGPASETGLFPAHEALTCAPITIADHRQLLMRVRDVRNAWLDPMQDRARANWRASETPIFADCAGDRLTHDASASGREHHPVKPSGLYAVLVELERDPLLGSLNETALRHRVKEGPLKGVVLSLDADDAAFKAGEMAFDAAFAGHDAPPTADGSGRDYTATARLALSDGNVAAFDALRLRVTQDRPRPGGPAVTATAADIAAELARDHDDAILRRFWEKQRRRAEALDRVACVLNAHRPLCEDWLSIRTAAPFRIGVCADIDLAPNADLERVQAEVVHAIELYLSPPVRWRTLDALLAEGVPADEIFNGPKVDWDFRCGGQPAFVKPGFLTAEDMAACDLRTSVHVSDIINEVVEIEGVLGIRNMTLRPYGADGLPSGPAEPWTLQVPPEHQPALHLEGSKLLLFKDELPYRAQEAEFLRTLEHLRAMAPAALYVPQGQVLPAVVGRWRGLDRAYTVQNDLPRLYGIGPHGLAPQEPPERFAQARQLKAYLAHFDWLLADWLGQIENARRLLSPDPALERTYFPARPDDATGVLTDYVDEVYVDPTGLLDDLRRARLTESEEVFLDRRSRALDHLLARFAERFGDYALMSFRLTGDSLGTAREIIADKAAFLAEAPELSRRRSEGFDYRPEDPARVWDTDNVPGLQRRVARLLGIADPTRRDLHCAALFDALIGTAPSGGGVAIRIDDAEGAPLFVSEESFPDAAAARAAARPIYDRLRRVETYAVDASGGVNDVALRLTDGGGTVLTHRDRVETEGEATLRARAIVLRHDALLASDLCNSEGLHVIEHILLRPRRPGDRLMQVCLPPDCAFCGEEDPYSFRLHVVLPYWPERFRNLDFRRYAERLIREETPAHVMPRICWVGNAEMRDLDLFWRDWLELTRDPAAAPPDRSAALGALIGALERLRTVNPPATLHDCAEGESDAIVRLDAATLGLF